MTPAKQEKIAKSQVRGKLTEAELEILRAMASGREIVFSQDGDDAWLVPQHRSGFLDGELVIRLREMGMIAPARSSDEEDTRFGVPNILTQRGRKALRTPTPTNSDSPTQVRNG